MTFEINPIMHSLYKPCSIYFGMATYTYIYIHIHTQIYNFTIPHLILEPAHLPATPAYFGEDPAFQPRGLVGKDLQKTLRGSTHAPKGPCTYILLMIETMHTMPP